MKISVLFSSLTMLGACTHRTSINGVFNGAAANHAEQTIKAIFFTTGDGISVGKWESKTAFGDGDITSNRPTFKDRTYQLVIKEGACKGSYDMHIVVQSNNVSGQIDGGKDCPNSQIEFNLIKED